MTTSSPGSADSLRVRVRDGVYDAFTMRVAEGLERGIVAINAGIISTKIARLGGAS